MNKKATNVERRKTKKIRARPDNVCLLLLLFWVLSPLKQHCQSACVEKIVTQEINVQCVFDSMREPPQLHRCNILN